MKVLIVDDEALARQRLEKMLEGMEGYEVVGQAENGVQALEMVEILMPDIVLLDIRMPGMDGLQVANQLAADAQHYGCRVIFTTAYQDYAIDAFDLQATGYLMKPVNRDKLARALEQASRITITPPASGRQHLSSSSCGKVELIPLDNVRVLQADHKYVTVYHTQGESLLDESLKTLEEEFPQRFKRVHRNALVAVDKVQGLEKNSQGQYVLKMKDTPVRPVVSRRLLTDIRQWLKQL